MTEPSVAAPVLKTRAGRIRVRCPGQNRAILLFVLIAAALSVLSIAFLDIDWRKLASRLGDLGVMFAHLAAFRFDQLDRIFPDLALSVSVTILATVYSLFAGLLLAALAAHNVVRSRAVNAVVRALFTFFRGIPTPVLVLLFLVCVGLGPAPAIAGIFVHSTAFFVRAFSQAYEEVTEDVIEALTATGASKTQIFLRAILPSASSNIFAWTGLRFEINFSDSTIMGMVGAGGIGYSIMNNMQGYDYGSAGLAILFVFVFTYAVELLITRLKLRYFQ